MAKLEFNNESTYKKFLEGGKEAEFDRLFDKAIEEVKKGFGKKYPMYIGGNEVFAQEQLEERSPINKDIVIGYFQKGIRSHAREAINAAKKCI